MAGSAGYQKHRVCELKGSSATKGLDCSERVHGEETEENRTHRSLHIWNLYNVLLRPK